MISSILFGALLIAAGVLFARNILKIRRNILLGRPIEINDQPQKRFLTMAKVAMGQSKMLVRPIPGLLHLLVYVGFVLINIEVLEIILDGLTNSHRILQKPLGGLYTLAIHFFEILGVGVILACALFLFRRYAQKLKRLNMPEMDGWPRQDATIILVIEIVLMVALLVMNAADPTLEQPFVISGLLAPLFEGMSYETRHVIERVCWWFHIVGILAFLNYLPFSKHFHILLAFPATYYSNLKAKGQFTNLEAVTKEVKLMMDPSADPYAAAPADEAPAKFGAKDVHDLTWKNLLDAYACTECGRCTSECPANITGKKLSPRRIMMATRDRMEEVGKNIDQHGKEHSDNKFLLGDYITEEELWACTSCNACTNACPINLDPLSIIMELRRDLVMEQSKAPAALNAMFTNIENNGAPWQFSPADRANWKDELI